jgi:16S rRNA (guanine527-N7)-methyltransferase
MRATHPSISQLDIQRTLEVYGFVPSEQQSAAISGYIDLLLKWNRGLSLTTVTNPAEIVGRHFGESMFVLKLLPVENCRLVDIGTGAGFPGLALKIASPSIELKLVESNKKKCVFLSEVVRSLELSKVEILSTRFEEIRPEGVKANVITSRAVGGHKELLKWAQSALAPRGHAALWVGAEDSTRISANLLWTWQPAVRIPESQRRFVLIGRPLERAANSGVT